jgi:hypothetical protein
MTQHQKQAIQAMLFNECQQNLDLAQWFYRISLAGYTTSIVLAIVATSLVYSGKLDAATVSGLSTLSVIACTRSLDRGGKQLRDATDRLCQLLETLDRPKPLPSKGDF